MAQRLKKDSSPSSPVEAKETLRDLIERHNELTLRIEFINAVLDMSRESFAHHDGLEPKNIVITPDGRRVQEHMIESILLEMQTKILDPLQNELKRLNSKKV
jgi:hypothetical protein